MSRKATRTLQRNYVRAGKLGADERIALMIERLREYDAEVVEAAPESLPADDRRAVGRERAAQVRGSGGVAGGVAGRRALSGRSITAFRRAEIEQAEGVVTAAFCGIADSGTIVLHHSAAEGRRVISLLPDWHLCVLRASQVVETLPEYFARCPEAPVLATYISGPSATADIEMTRIKGVHGPRFLHVIVVRDDSK